MIRYPRPLLGFSAFSGTGKTTLLKRLLPLLRANGVRIGVVKHAHHRFDIDHPNKDSYELRKAGAEQMLIASRRRMAWITEFSEDHGEPALEETLEALDPTSLDLVLVEGFKRDPFPKIELHRPSLGRPLLYPNDPDIIAVATDDTLPARPDNLRLLDLNNIEEIAGFVLRRLPPPHETRFNDQLC
jgi:molybdopterin-guanine dinucleotide biosynthesis protein MobB